MGIGSFHPNGKPYQVKGAGSFFLKNDFIYKSPQEVIELLKQDWQIEIKTMREHFAYQLIPAEMPFTLTEKSFFIPSREPPGKLNNLSKIANY